MLTYASYKSNLCFLGENAPMRWIRRERKWFIGSVEIYPLGINEHHFFFFFHSFSVEFHSNPLLNRTDPLQVLRLRRYFLREHRSSMQYLPSKIVRWQFVEIYLFRINEYNFNNFFPIEFHSKSLLNRRNVFKLFTFIILLVRIIHSRSSMPWNIFQCTR